MRPEGAGGPDPAESHHGPVRVLLSNSMRGWGGGENWTLTASMALSKRPDMDVRVLCAPGSALHDRLGSAIPSAGSPGSPSVFTAGLRGPALMRDIVRVARMIRNQRIDVACVNLGRELRALSLAALLSARPMALLRRRGSDLPLGNGPLDRLMYGRIVSRLVVNSETTRRTILDRSPWLGTERLVTIHNGIPTEVYRPDPRLRESGRDLLDLPGRGPVVGTSGNIVPRKDLETLLRACGAVDCSPAGDPVVAIAGSAPDPRYLELLRGVAREEGIDSRVRFLGELGEERLPAFYNRLDLFVSCSRNEGFGYALAEAMSSGVPCIAANASSLPEVLGTSGVSGILFPPGNADALSSAIERLLGAPDLAGSMARSARKRILTRFSLESATERLASVLHEVADETPGRRRDMAV